jgi:dinuclear metal center YbgI/SA1388 family protein
MKQESNEKLMGRAVRQRVEALAPPTLAESWDNVGWQVGGDAVEVRAVLVSLDVDHTIVEEAARLGANLIVAHHPILFRGLKHIDPTSYQGRMLRRLLCEEIHVFAAHTNLDAVRGGVNDALADALGLTPSHPLQPVRGAPEAWGFGAICEGDGVSTTEMVQRVSHALGVAQPRVTPGLGAPPAHERIALLGGSGASMIEDALRAGCTLYITGEVKYHEAQDAARAGLTLIETGHFHSERPVLQRVVAWLAALGVPVYESKQVTSPFEADWKEGVG